MVTCGRPKKAKIMRTCDICKVYTTPRAYMLARHRSTCKPPPEVYRCDRPGCSRRRFDDKKYLLSHMINLHGMELDAARAVVYI